MQTVEFDLDENDQPNRQGKRTSHFRSDRMKKHRNDKTKNQIGSRKGSKPRKVSVQSK